MKSCWARFYLVVFLWSGSSMLVFGADTPSAPSTDDMAAKQKEALGQVRDHLQGAMKALGEAGRLTLESQLPALEEKTDQAIKDAKRLLQELEQRLKMPKQEEKKNVPAQKSDGEVSAI